MALRQLAGPFTVTNDQGVPPASIAGWRWYPDVGILSFISGYQCFLTLDGIYQPISSSHPSLYGYWPLQKRWMTWNMPAENKEYTLDPKSLIAVAVDGADKVVDGFFFFGYVKLADRRIFYGNHQMLKIVNKVQTVDTADTAIFEWGLVGPGRTDTEVFVGETGDIGNSVATSSETRCCFYDTLTKKFTPPMYLGMGSHGVIYAPELGVIISVHDGPPIEVRVWSLEVLPTSLSNPVVIENTPKGGLITTYQVQALGSNNEPCVGEFIDWQVFGVGNPIGTQSQTDEHGYATIRVLYRLGDTGESVVQANLVC